jgi:hypothetical protein
MDRTRRTANRVIPIKTKEALTKKKFWQQFFATRFKGVASERNRDSDMPEPELVPVEQLAGMLRAMNGACRFYLVAQR